MTLAIVGDAGHAIFTMLSVVGLAVIGILVFSYAAHCFLAVSDATAGGADEVPWPDDGIIDSIPRGAYMAWIAIVTLAPSFVLGSLLGFSQSAVVFVLTVFFASILFPVVMMSALSGTSVFFVFQPPIIARLARRPDHTIAYWLASAPVTAMAAAGIALIHRTNFVYSIPGAIMVGAAIMVVARLYGRLAHVMSDIRLPTRKAKAGAKKRREAWVPPTPAATFDPNEPPESALAAEGYGLNASYRPPEDGPVKSALPRLWIEDDDDGKPIAFAEPAPEKQLLPPTLMKVSEAEMKLISSERPPPPRHPWMVGTYSFVLRLSTLSRVGLIAVGLSLGGVLWRVVFAAAKGNQ